MKKSSKIFVKEMNSVNSEKSLDWLEIFKRNHIQTNKQCKHSECQTGKKYCLLESKIFENFMTSLESEYIVTPPIKIIASKLAANIILSDRMHRQIKLEGASTTVRKENDEGVTEFNVENPLLPSLHLVENRIIRLFKELKLTPKEGSKKEQSMDLQKILKKLNVVK